MQIAANYSIKYTNLSAQLFKAYMLKQEVGELSEADFVNIFKIKEVADKKRLIEDKVKQFEIYEKTFWK